MNIAIILLAGNSSRIHNTSTPKQFVLVNDIPVFIYTVKAFDTCYEVDEIVLVTKKDSIDYVKEQIQKFGIKKVDTIVEGGKTRQESAYNGLKAKNYSDNDIIIIHDGARALVSKRIINDSINACKEFGAVTTAVECADTLLKSNEDNIVSSYVSREGTYRVQTPQTFRYRIIKQAHDKNIGKKVSDDSSIVNMYWPVHVINGDQRNFKITVDDDLELFKEIINGRK